MWLCQVSVSGDNTPTILERLAQGGLLVSDGATGTYLQTHGLEPGGCPEEFNSSHPEVVRGMARAYFDAGSDMVLTNSFGANRFMLGKYGYGDRVAEFNRLAAQHARSQSPAGGYVIGSVGPIGEFLQPLGEVGDAEMLDAFVEQVVALEEGGADGVVVETMTALEEAALAIRAAKENTRLAVFATMVFDKGPRGFFTMMGVTPERAVAELEEAGADVVGANCGNGIDIMVELARELRTATSGYLLIHSNAGIPTLKKGEVVYLETPEFMSQRFLALADLGINIIGGCCGTGPEHIRALAAQLKGRVE
ncbi:MAG: homocysteine S-methyltransferase family protein [Chloroflexi bacterium]|nr:homocysteine S-methyltransferase family protein [Chloroflexota bacterium]